MLIFLTMVLERSLISDSSWCAGPLLMLKRQEEKNNGNSPDGAPEKKAATEIRTASNTSALVLQMVAVYL